MRMEESYFILTSEHVRKNSKKTLSLTTTCSLVPFYEKIFHAILLPVKANKSIIHYRSALLFPQVSISFRVQPKVYVSAPGLLSSLKGCDSIKPQIGL